MEKLDLSLASDRLQTFETGPKAPYLPFEKEAAANAGFYYWNDYIVKCVDCQLNIDIYDLTTDPRNRKYHEKHCSFGRTVYKLKDDALCHLVKKEVCVDEERKMPTSTRHSSLELKVKKDYPKSLQSDEAQRWVEAVKDLTCKVAVRIIDPDNKTNGNKKQFGTGCVVFSDVCYSSVGDRRLYDYVNCMWAKDLPKIDNYPTKRRFFFEVVTVRHVLSDMENPKNTEIHFEEFPETKIVVHGAKKCRAEGSNKVFLLCEVTDWNFKKWLDRKKIEAFKLSAKLPLEAKQFLSESVMVVSYPHGNVKAVTFGRCSRKTYVIEDQVTSDDVIKRQIVPHQESNRKQSDVTTSMLLYSAETDKGSSGAPVFSFEKQEKNDGSLADYPLVVGTHCGVFKENNKNCSTLEYSHRGPLRSEKELSLNTAAASSTNTGEGDSGAGINQPVATGIQPSLGTIRSAQPASTGNQPATSGGRQPASSEPLKAEDEKRERKTTSQPSGHGGKPAVTNGNQPSSHESKSTTASTSLPAKSESQPVAASTSHPARNESQPVAASTSHPARNESQPVAASTSQTARFERQPTGNSSQTPRNSSQQTNNGIGSQSSGNGSRTVRNITQPTRGGSGQSGHGQIRINHRPPIYPDFADFRKRLSTFEGWTHNLKHTPREFAHGGFYWSGSGDCLHCFYCGLKLENWTVDGDLYDLHKRKRSTCGYHQIQMSTDRIRCRETGRTDKTTHHTSREDE